MTVDKTPVEYTPACGNRRAVDKGVAAGQGVRWECCEKCSGPRLVTEGLTPSDLTGKELLTW